MHWLTISAITTGIWLLAKKPESSEIVPKPAPAPTPKPATTKPAAPASKPTAPLTVTKTVVTNGRKYTVTRAGLGIFLVSLASDPSVFQLIGQRGPLQEGGDPELLAQLKSDENQFPAGLFT